MHLGGCTARNMTRVDIAIACSSRFSVTPLGTFMLYHNLSLGFMPSCSISATLLHSHQKMEVVVPVALCSSLLSPSFMPCV